MLHQDLSAVLTGLGINYTQNHWDNTPIGDEWNADFVFKHPVTQQPTIIQTLWFDDMDSDLYEQQIQQAIERNQLYLMSGYKTLWLVEAPVDQDCYIRELLQEHQYASMPMFYFKKFNIFHVSGWRSNAECDNHVFFDMSATTQNLATKKYFDYNNEVNWLSLIDFLKQFFNHGIRWTLEPINTTLSLALVERNCWKCNTPQNLIKRVNIIGKPFPEQQKIKVVLHYSTLDQAPLDEETIARLNSLEMRKKYNYGLIAMRYSKTVGSEYLSVGCLSCGVLQGQNFIDNIILNPQDYRHTDEINTGKLSTDQDTYENMGEWILIQNELLELHQYRNLGI